MNRISVIAILLAASALTAAAAPRFALIRVRDIYSSLPSTEALQVQIKQEQEAIMKDQRAEELRKTLGELQALQAKLSDKNNPLDEETSRKLARSYEIKRQEAQTLQKEFESFRTEQEKLINTKMVSSMRASLDKIVAASNKVAKEKGFDCVFDSSGNTNTGVPFVLYSKDSADLTEDIKAALKDAAQPSAAAAKPATPPKR
ncbi:MAG: OmpH family outer membrane protein [Gloeobacteraceae cyanobacterium ES-bin-144]|nr:OmpH family outer membrane protein [Verrucomicrobiales bacterium]